MKSSERERLICEDAITTLWERLGESFGSSFLNQYGDVGGSAFQTWTMGLIDLTPAQIEKGFINCLRSESKYAPTLKVFREHCMDIAQHGLPSLTAAYEEACKAPSPKDRQKWSHPAVYHAGRLTGWSELHAIATNQMLPRYQYNYEILCKRVIAGENINLDVPQAIPRKITKLCTAQENIEHMKKLKAEMGWD